MKPVLLTTALFIVSVAICLAQAPPKKARVIKIENTLSKEENFKHVIESLIDNGFDIEAKDREFGTIRTHPRPGESNVSYFLSIVVKDHLIVVRGQMLWNAEVPRERITQVPAWEEIRFIGAQNSVARAGWDPMYEQAMRFQATGVSFEL